MTDLLERVKKQIIALEKQKKTQPEYYARYSVEQHKLFIQIEKELTPQPKRISHKQCLSCSCADRTISYSDWWYCTNPKNFRDFTVLRDKCYQRPKWCLRGK